MVESSHLRGHWKFSKSVRVVYSEKELVLFVSLFLFIGCHSNVKWWSGHREKRELIILYAFGLSFKKEMCLTIEGDPANNSL